ncbi:MAG: globin [Actinomycetes bacterium]
MSSDTGDTLDSPYELMGGAETFERLVAAFYAGVASDPELRPMYPESDLAPAQRRLLMFLEQYWGGPRTYSDERGHPRLRLRHAPYPVDGAARDRWLFHMEQALATVEMPDEQREQLWSYLVMAAHSMVNTPD